MQSKKRGTLAREYEEAVQLCEQRIRGTELTIAYMEQLVPCMSAPWDPQEERRLRDIVQQYIQKDEILLEEYRHKERVLLQWLEELPPKLKETMRLILVEGKTHDQVAELLDKDSETITRRRKKAREILEPLLAGAATPTHHTTGQ